MSVAERSYWNAEIETQPAPERAAMQLDKLRRQLAYVVDRSPFYARKFASAGFDASRLHSLDDLRLAPFTTKEELRESQIASPPLGNHAAAELRDVIRIHSSSGTTGRPSYVGITRRDRDVWTETVSRVYWCEGVRPEDVVVHGFGLGFFVGGLPLKDAIENIGATFIPIGTGASNRLVTSIRDLGGTVLTCTPSYATYLAEFVRNRLQLEPSELGLQRILLGAEPGGGIPAVRDQLAEEFGAFVTESLGNADLIPTYSANCDELDGNHFLAPDFMLLEVVDPDSGEPLGLEHGVEGELVATHLERECVPLVRFRVRDRVRVKTSPCACGRTTPRLNCVGRTDDLLIVAGVNVWPSAIKDVVTSLHPRTTGALQILLSAPPPRVEPPLRIQVEYGAQARDLRGLKHELEELIRDKLIAKAAIELVPPDTLPRSEMKTQLTRKLYEETEVTAT
jgi:phenylacetate-CoA ligase